jgi:hypothetical protein
VADLEIAGGQAGSVQLLAAEDFDYPLAEGETIEIRVSGAGFVYAPVAEGAKAGTAHICIDGNSVGKIPLIYGKTVEKIPEEEKSFWDRLFGSD